MAISVTSGGFVVSTQNGNELLIARAADGAYDYAALNAKLQDLKARFPGESSVIITAEPKTDYDTIVSTADAARETSARTPLFPDVTLAYF